MRKFSNFMVKTNKPSSAFICKCCFTSLMEARDWNTWIEVGVQPSKSALATGNNNCENLFIYFSKKRKPLSLAFS
ncbi:hypothetical protein SCA6_014511 [Theobroma cacao]